MLDKNVFKLNFVTVIPNIDSTTSSNCKERMSQDLFRCASLGEIIILKSELNSQKISETIII